MITIVAKNGIIKILTLPLTLAFMLTTLAHLLVTPTTHAADTPTPITLGTYYDILQDPSNEITFEQIISGVYDDSFVRSTEDYLNFWHTDDTIWLRLDADEIILDKNETHWLEFIDKLEHIELYLLKEDGAYEVKRGGFSHLEQRELIFRSILFTIDDPTTREIYLKIEGSMPLTVISTLYTTNGFIEKIISYKFLTGAFYGFLTALSIYNLFLFFSLKEKSYLYYVFYMWSFMVFQATMNTFDIELLGDLFPEWFFTRSLVLSCNLLLLCMILFGKEFLELKKYLPKHHRLLMISFWINIGLIIAVLFTRDVSMVNNFTTVFTMGVLVFLWVSGLRLLLKGHKAARFYMVGWTILLASIVVQGMGFMGVIPLHPRIYEDVPAIGAIFEAIFLSLALGDKINIIKREHQDMQQQLNASLELKVKERTVELEKAKQELERLATTDRLTGIANRARLDHVMEIELERARSDGVPLSIILLDIDHFKEVNDQFGHQVGDKVLIEAAELLTNAVTNDEIVGRWGGEEFLIICPGTNLEGAIRVSEKIRKQIENHTFPVVKRKTGSFGITQYTPGDTQHTILSRCDQALYKAKHQGRNTTHHL